MFKILPACLFWLLLPSMLCAATVQKTLTVEFAYNGSGQAGFRLYMNGVVVMDKDILTADKRTGTKLVNIIEGRNEFYLTAVDSAGKESSHSNSYFYEYLDVPAGNGEIMLRIKIQ